ncbi:MAG: glycosyl transferase [Chitinophagales bacterium]|nr:MAG: glycosyl transferase [Chitinophagales bacterium]
MKPYDYSVVVPVFNSAGTLRLLFDRIRSFFEKRGSSYQVIFVDDGSNDTSWSEILKIKEAFPDHVTGIRLSTNSGQQKATLCGLNHARGKMIITIDDDLQIPPEEIAKLIKTQEETGADLVFGLFDVKRHSLIRRIGSWLFVKIFAPYSSIISKGSSFRLISHEITSRLGGINQKYLLLDEVLHWYTNNIAYCTVEHQKRMKGQSGYSIFKLISISINYIIYYTVIPLRLMTYIGLLSSFAVIIVAMIYFYRWLVLDVPAGYTSTLLAIFFTSSIILFSLGIIGEYISRIYVQEISKPPYVIKEIR